MSEGYGDISKAALLTEEEREQSVVITDPAQPDNPMIFISEEFEKQTGYSPKEALGKNCRFLQGPETDPAAIEAIRRALDAESDLTIDILNYRKDGAKFWNRLRIRPLVGDDNEVMFYVGAQNPIDTSEVRTVPTGSSAT
jgi:PAS domain S-box-containing protein